MAAWIVQATIRFDLDDPCSPLAPDKVGPKKGYGGIPDVTLKSMR
jgi:hypothetical protein